MDWNFACVSNPRLDLGFWLPSLTYEGGPSVRLSAARAGLPGIQDAPRVRVVQRQQLEIALPWVARALDLPPPGRRKRV